MSEANTVNDIFPHRDGYHRPDRADDYQPTPVIARAVTTNGTTVQQAHAAMTHAKTEFEKHINTVKRHRDHYSDEGLRAQIGNFTGTDAARAVNEKLEQVRQRRDEAQTHVDKVRRDLSPKGDTAAELRATRYWDRTLRILDNADPGKLPETARNLLRKSDRAEIGTLLQELPAYLQARGQTNDWLDAAVAEAAPEFDSARKQLTKADQALQITQYNAKALLRGFSEGRPPTVLVDPSNYDPDR